MEKIRLHWLILYCLWQPGYAAYAQQTAPVITTTTVLADLVRQVAGPEVPVASMLPIGTDPHTYEALPQTVHMARRAELIFINGLTLEGWLQKLITHSDTKARVVIVSQGVTPLAHPDNPSATDPHAWMDPLHVITYLHNIRDGLSAWKPAQADAFARNCRAYEDSLQALHRWISLQWTQVPAHRRVLVTTHDGFRYYTLRYGIQALPLMGTTTDADVRAGDLRRISHLITTQDVTAVFIEQGINPALLERLAAEHGITVAGPLYGDSVSPPDGPAGNYLSLMRHNTRVLVSALATQPHTHQVPAPSGWGLWVAGMGTLLLAGLGFLWMRVKRPASPALPAHWALRLEQVGVRYGAVTAVEAVTLTLQPGRVYGVMGANGCGKSSLLHALVGVVPATGRMEIAGKPLSQWPGKVAWVPQRAQIDLHFPLTVAQVAGMGRLAALPVGRPMRAADRAAIQDALETVGLAHLAHRAVGELSGGQLQRALLAQALCQDAAIYLLDEPFAALDAESEALLLQLIRQLAAQGKLVVVVHHDLQQAATLFDEIILLNRKVLVQGTPEAVLQPHWLQQAFGNYSAFLPHPPSSPLPLS
ncbi:MAG: zinc ABC transporter substrate-binding protein [Bacteroidetes bacterium]|nr:zinc ABC transporter substrate-binding protein [Bacteroidota bacterium]